ncbi:Uncharacterised protein family (UPF0270) [Salmonella enterica subsp. enterica serovar Typhimurium]|nr:Uncharacterised protein family (UPF0270) [Salmonella enterica subsp. enterica serovar Typhimurium]
MIIPWQGLAPDTLDNLIESFVLREGTDYGEHERSLEQKVADVKTPTAIRRGRAGMGLNYMKRSILCRKSSFANKTPLPTIHYY